jgi:AraC-like DNA-binding protein
MHLLCKNEQADYLNYNSGDKPAIEVKLILGANLFEGCTGQDKIIFLLEGQLTYSFGIFDGCSMSGRQILFLPAGCPFIIEAEGEARVLVIRLPHKICFHESCGIDSPADLVDAQDSKGKNSKGKDKKGKDKNKKTSFLLEINHAMDAYIDSMLMLMQGGLRYSYYYETKIKELFHLFSTFYSREELAWFFREASGSDSGFSYFVFNNYHKYKTLSDMAAAMNMTLSGFEKHFKKVFATSACKWINAHKAKRIYYVIRSGESTFKELCYHFGFSSQPAFNDFCKKNLGMTPGQIRRKTQPGRNDECFGENEE